MKATRWEILGAWLRIWTAPRDVEIPPIPWRAIALLAGVVAAATVAGILLVVPALDRSKQRTAAIEQRREAAAARATRARLRHDQRALTARATSVARLYRSGREAAARAELLRHARASVRRDARARVAAGEFDVPVRSARCRPRPGGVAPRVLLACLAITTENAQVRVGQPFLVAGSLRDGRYAWCHQNPPPGEGMAGRGVGVALPTQCTE